MLDGLVKALTANDHHELQWRALVLLHRLSQNAQTALKIVKCPDAVHELVNVLGKRSANPRRQQVAWVMAALVQHKDIGLELANVPGILKGLVKASLEVDNRDLQAAAVDALTEFSRLNESIQLQMVNVPGMLDGLVKALTANDHHELQSGASNLLCRLSQNAHTALKIVKCPDAFDELVNSLGKGSGGGSEFCVQALEHVAFHDDSVKVRLLQFTDGLVKDVFNDQIHDIQARALDILAMLAQENDVSRLQMDDFPRMLERLIKALTSDNHHEFQNDALEILIALSSNDRAASKIVECPGALRELVHGLGKVTNEIHQKRCAGALRQLASLGDSMRIKLIQFPNLIEQLVGALIGEGVDKYPSKEAAGHALTMLAIGNHHIKSEIMHRFPGLLETLIDAIRKDDNDGQAIYLLTALSPQRGKEIHLNSEVTYSRRGESEAHLGLYEAALEDLDEACRLGESALSLRIRYYVQARLSNFQAALHDAISAYEKCDDEWILLDIAVLKRILGDLPGALEDVQCVRRWRSIDFVEPRMKYTGLKHRGFIKFLLGDEDGARADAEWALRCKPLAVHEPEYGTRNVAEGWSVEYLNFQLR